MNVTSHFIGIKIKSRLFVDMFVALQQYIKENNLEQIIELQNILSLHITLYYLKKDIFPEERGNIKQTLSHINNRHKDFKIVLEKVSYFKNEGRNYLGYISCSPVNYDCYPKHNFRENQQPCEKHRDWKSDS